MEENGFRTFFSILKTIEAEASVENAVVRIIDSTEKAMTPEQKQRIYGEFVHYENLRRKRRDAARRSEQIEKEKYREFLRGFFRSEDFTGWDAI